MKFDIDYIRNYMNNLDEITGHNTKNVPIELSSRMTRGYGYCEYEFVNGRIKTKLFKFSKNLLECGANKEQIDDVIRHEYCHSWADEGYKESSNHKGRFVECCNKLKCRPEHCSKDMNLNKKFREYNMKKERKENYRLQFEFDVFEQIYSMKYSVKGIRDNGITVVKVNYTLNEGYSIKDIEYIINRLENNNRCCAVYTNKGNKGTIVYCKQ